MKFDKFIHLVIILICLYNIYSKKHLKNLVKDDPLIDIPLYSHKLPYENLLQDIKNDTLEKSFSARKSNKCDEFFDKTKYYKVITCLMDSGVLIISFRGTDNLDNWITDMEADQVVINGCNDCLISKGFNYAFNILEKQTFNSIDNKLRDNQSISHILFTGHSLGGAITTIAAFNFLKIRKNYTNIKKVSLITVGAPRVGNKNFANFLNQGNLYYNLRIIYGKDPVPALPPVCLGYKHAGTEIRYIQDKKAFSDYDRLILGKSLKDTCNDINLTNILDHTKYKDIDKNSLWEFIQKEVTVYEDTKGKKIKHKRIKK